jgi:hypothetical protein
LIGGRYVLCIGEGPVRRSFYYINQSCDFFTFLEIIVTGWLVTFCWSEDPSTAWLVPSTAIPLADENWFLQASKGAENTKEKSRQCFTYYVPSIETGIKLVQGLVLPQVPMSVVWICTFKPYPTDRIHDKNAYVMNPRGPKLC